MEIIAYTLSPGLIVFRSYLINKMKGRRYNG